MGMKKSNILEKEFNKVILNIKNNINDCEVRWEVYQVIISEISKDVDLIKEFKYRLTDGEDINLLILDFINKNKNNDILWFLKPRIQGFIDDDFFSKFV